MMHIENKMYYMAEVFGMIRRVWDEIFSMAKGSVALYLMFLNGAGIFHTPGSGNEPFRFFW